MTIALLLLIGFTTPSASATARGTETLPATTPQSAPASDAVPPAQDIPDTYEMVGENETFQLYANRASLAFKVVDKRDGYVWSSNLDEKVDGDRLNKTWTAFAQSGISINYLDPKATDERASITNTEPTIVFTPNGQGFDASVTFTDALITVGVSVNLEPDGVRVEVPFASIKEDNPEFRLGLLHLYPFFGATRTDSIPGYMFIPDGSGTLIRFAADTKANNMFYGRYYGADLGMISYLPWEPTVIRPYRISIPVIGMVHEEQKNAYLAILEKGASYGEIQAHPAGIITNFNFMYNAFIYNESYFQATNKSGAGVTTLQPATNAFDITLHYRFLAGEGADYVGMARSYQKYLLEKGDLQKSVDTNGDIGIRLEFLGGEKEKVLFWHRTIPMTTVSQMADILSSLNVKNPEVIYYGWQPLGASTMPPTRLKLDGKLGSIGELRDLADKIQAEGGQFSLYLNPQAALRDEKGYSLRHDLAMSITNLNLIGYNRDMVNYFFNVDTLTDRYTSLSPDVFSDLGAGLALDGIGGFLYSDFKDNHFLNREEAIQRYQDLVDQQGGRTGFYRPNDYMFGAMSAYYDMPLGNSGYIYTSEVVPFLQIVFAGYVPMYGPAFNFSSNLQEDLLRHADFGVYPSYFLTEDVTAKIINTPSSWIFSSSYGQWGDEIEQTYAWLDALLGPVKGQGIVAREVLGDGVSATTYANGKQIIVNFNDQAFTYGGVEIPAKDAVIWEVTP